MLDTSGDTRQQLEAAVTHMQANRLREAAEICTDIIGSHPDDADALHLLGTLLLKIGKPAVAIKMLKRAVKCQPNCALAYNSLGVALHRTGFLKDAVSALDKAISLAHDLHQARQNRDAIMAEIDALDDEITLLEERNAAPTVTFSKEEQERSSISLQSLNRAASLYDHFGFLIIEGLYEESFIDGLNNYFRKKYSAYFEDKDYSDALSVGDKRNMVSIGLDGPFNDPLFYGHPLMRPLFERLLGKDYILDSLDAVISLPGATLQQLHSDGGDLFDDNMKSSITIPAYAITMGIPLIEMNTTTGTTRMFQ